MLEFVLDYRIWMTKSDEKRRNMLLLDYAEINTNLQSEIGPAELVELVF